jgi:hypothetical protein
LPEKAAVAFEATDLEGAGAVDEPVDGVPVMVVFPP